MKSIRIYRNKSILTTRQNEQFRDLKALITHDVLEYEGIDPHDHTENEMLCFFDKVRNLHSLRAKIARHVVCGIIDLLDDIDRPDGFITANDLTTKL